MISIGSRANRQTANHGFTLVEVAVAIVVLGIALTSLIGLQTNHLNSYFRQKHQFKAALYAKQFMTILESQREPPELGTTKKTLLKALKDEGLEGKDDEDLAETLTGWTYEQSVTSVDTLPELEGLLSRIDLTIGWGDRVGEDFTLIYIMKAGDEGVAVQ